MELLKAPTTRTRRSSRPTPTPPAYRWPWLYRPPTPTTVRALFPLVQAFPTIRSRRGPRRRPAKLDADKGYDYEHLRVWLRRRRPTPRIARRDVESSTRLGRHRWVLHARLPG